MWWQARNKMLVVSLSLAAAGMLACIAAVYDSFVPKGSLVAFFATMLPLGLLVAGLVVVFVWLCERFESTPERRDEQRLKLRPPDFPTPIEQRRHLLDEIDRHRDVSPFPKQTLAGDRYLDGLRGPARPRVNDVRTPPLAGQWHGQ
jgi:hypothetical protein